MSAKIAYLLKKFPRLSETFVLNEILQQEALGRNIHIFSRREPDDEPRHPQLTSLAAEVEALPSMRGMGPWLTLFEHSARDPELMSRFGELARELARFDHPRMHQLFAEALHLLDRTRELGIEHVHVHFATDSAITAMILAELGGPGYSLTAHAKDIYRSTVDAALLARIVERSRFTVTVCDANVRHLEQKLPESAMRKVRRLYNGIRLHEFSSPAGQDEREPDHILSVGRLVEKKGFDVLLHALALLRDHGRTFRATIAGDGDQAEALETLRDELDLADRVTFTGPLDQAAVRELMGRATVFCLPCRIGEDGNRDALPTVLLEALAMRLPCISTPVTGIPEILDEGRVGRIVPENDPEATAAALAELLDSPETRERLAAEGRLHAERNFDAQTVAQVLSEWFEEACALGSVAQA